MKQGVTIGTLALDLGMAKSTVSRALKGDRRISKATKDRVLNHAASVGFELHPYVQVLMTQRKMQRQVAAQANLVYLNDYSSMKDFERRPTARRIYEAARERAREKGWNLDVKLMNPADSSGQIMAKMLRQRGVLGIILGRTLAPKLGVPPALLHFSLVSDSRYWGTGGLDRVSFSGMEMFSRLLLQIFELGAKKAAIYMPAHLTGPGCGPISEVIQLLSMTGKSLVVIDPSICSADSMRQELKKCGADAFVFHHREQRSWLVKMLADGEFTGLIAEYGPPNDDPLPWMNVTIPAQQIGATLADTIIDKVCRSDIGLADFERVIGFQGGIREGVSIPSSA